MLIVTIQTASNPSDLEAIRHLLRAYAAHLAATPANICVPNYEHELATLPGSYAAPAGTILLARIDGQPAGCIAFRSITPKTEHERACEMKRLWVNPAFRGHNLGLRLIEAGMAWANTNEYDAMYLDTVPAAMPHANTIYQRLGFRPVDRYNDNPVSDVVFLRLPLGRLL